MVLPLPLRELPPGVPVEADPALAAELRYMTLRKFATTCDMLKSNPGALANFVNAWVHIILRDTTIPKTAAPAGGPPQ